MDDVSCDDGNPCTGGDVCSGASCQGTQLPAEQLAELDCTCEVDEDCALLDDGDVCNGTLHCDLEQEPPTCLLDHDTIIDVGAGDCDDGVNCTDDSCEPEEGCVNLALDELCDDGNQCTDDVCDPEAGCISTVVDGPCDDGNLCTQDDMCLEGECFGVPKACDDGLFCNGAEVCGSESGVCMNGVAPSLQDGVDCTVDLCDEAADLVLNVPDDLLCDDGEDCTTDVCNPYDGCEHAVAPDGTLCEDDNACTVGDVCAGGTCKSGDLIICEDDSLCTEDFCNAEQGCVFAPVENGTLCDDLDNCTLNDHCAAGTCLGPAALDCDDANPCTDDACDPDSGCVNIPNDENPCLDDDVCNGDESCTNGECTLGAPLVCDDDNECTTGLCNPEAGCLLQFVEDGTSCGDSDGGICQNGNCCLPLCEDVECGDDGCGGGCGECESPLVCGADQQCTVDTEAPHDGLMLLYKLDGGSGIDYSGNGNDATVSSYITGEGIDGVEDSCVCFDDAHLGSISPSNESLLDGWSQFSIHAWINASSLETNATLVYATHLDNCGSDESEVLYLKSDGRLCSIVSTGCEDFTQSCSQDSGVVPIGKWTAVGIVWDNGSAQFFVDGLAVQTDLLKSGGFKSDLNDNLILCHTDAGANQFKGCIDDILFYDRLLTEDEIFDYFEATSPDI